MSEREIRSGFAEIIKHSLIADEFLWSEIKKLGNWEITQFLNFSISQLIVSSLKTKQRIVEQDPFEKGIRKALNFGHTIGHAVESLFLKTEKPLLHGEAIAIGMICESWLSHKILNLPLSDLQNITSFLTRLYGHTNIPEKDFDILLDIMQNDKKNEQDQINFSLIQPIGNCVINQYVEIVDILESLHYYNSLRA